MEEAINHDQNRGTGNILVVHYVYDVVIKTDKNNI